MLHESMLSPHNANEKFYDTCKAKKQVLLGVLSLVNFFAKVVVKYKNLKKSANLNHSFITQLL
jgi:hypothetical protein